MDSKAWRTPVRRSTFATGTPEKGGTLGDSRVVRLEELEPLDAATRSGFDSASISDACALALAYDAATESDYIDAAPAKLIAC